MPAEQDPPVDPHADTTFVPPPGAAQAETVELRRADPQAETRELPAHRPGEGPAPTRIGVYEVREELARGGMGIVYRAWHPGLRREVALKVLTAGRVATRAEVERFRLEARAAARLQHPNVVAVHDVGEDQGLPWLAMDLVPGRSLAARIEAEGPLPSPEAARIALGVARALAHAHAFAVLHRDVKPGNVLLDPGGEPRLTDFGLAKDLRLEGQGAKLTETGIVVGTPAYMPPEQARGQAEAIDRRADVWALGATLYEMLAGRPPFRGPTALAVIQQVLHREPAPPGRLHPGVDPALETISLRCLEKEPELRYATASALAEDLERFLARAPILARRPGPAARLGRWVRRNRRLARGAALLLLALLGAGAAAGAGFVHRLRQERDRADAAAGQAVREAERAEREAREALRQAGLARESLDLLVFEVEHELADVPGSRVRAARRRLLEQALAGLERLRWPEGATGQEALRQAEVLRQEGDLALAVGQTARAARAWERALTLTRTLERQGPEGAAARRELGRLLRAVSRVRGEGGDLAGALAAAREALTLAADPAERCLGEGALGQVLQRQGDVTRAAEARERALAAARELKEPDGALLLEALGEVASSREARGDLAGAAQAWAERIEPLRRAVAADPQGWSRRRRLASALADLGRVLARQERFQDAAPPLEEALALRRALLPLDPDNVEEQEGLAAALNALAQVREGQGRAQEAVALHDECLAVSRALLAREPENRAALRALATAQGARGSLHLARWEHESARAALEESLACLARLVALDGADAEALRAQAHGLLSLGILEQRLGRTAPATTALEQALAASARLIALDPDNAAAQRDRVVALGQLAAGHLQRGEIEACLDRYGEALAAVRRLLAQDATNSTLARNLTAILGSQALVLRREGRLAEAIACLEEAAREQRRLSAPAPHDRVVALPELERQLAALQTERDAAEAFLAGQRSPGSPREHLILARALVARGQDARAVPAFEAALRERALRQDPDEAPLFAAACAAARAATATGGEEGARLLGVARAWVTEAVTTWRTFQTQLTRMIPAEPDPRLRFKLEELQRRLDHLLRRVRADEPALAPLRAEPAFEALFR